LKYCNIDGSGAVNGITAPGIGIVLVNSGGNVLIEYNWVTNAWSELFTIGALTTSGNSYTLQYNASENSGLGGPPTSGVVHGDHIQFQATFLFGLSACTITGGNLLTEGGTQTGGALGAFSVGMFLQGTGVTNGTKILSSAGAGKWNITPSTNTGPTEIDGFAVFNSITEKFNLWYQSASLVSDSTEGITFSPIGEIDAETHSNSTWICKVNGSMVQCITYATDWLRNGVTVSQNYVNNGASTFNNGWLENCSLGACSGGGGIGPYSGVLSESGNTNLIDGTTIT
jgi:hypothetical protein